MLLRSLTRQQRSVRPATFTRALTAPRQSRTLPSTPSRLLSSSYKPTAPLAPARPPSVFGLWLAAGRHKFAQVRSAGLAPWRASSASPMALCAVLLGGSGMVYRQQQSGGGGGKEEDEARRRRRLERTGRSLAESPVEMLLDKLYSWKQKYTPVGLAIAATHLAVFALWRFLPSSVMRRHFALHPAHFLSRPGRNLHTLFTSMVSHQGLFHLGFNTMAMLSMAPLLVRVMGQEQFLLFYVGSGLLTGLASLLTPVAGMMVARNASRMALLANRVSLGASGAVISCFGVISQMIPDAEFALIFLPMVTFTADNLFKGLVAFETGGAIWNIFKHSPIDHMAHLSGIGVGYTFYHSYLKKNNFVAMRLDERQRHKRRMREQGGEPGW